MWSKPTGPEGRSCCSWVKICTQLEGGCCWVCQGLPPPHLLLFQAPCQSIFSNRRNQGLMNLLLCKFMHTDIVFITALGQPTSENNWSSLHNSRKKRTRILVCAFVYIHVSDSLSLCVFDPGTAYTNRAQLSAVFVMALCWLIIWPLTSQVFPAAPLCHRLTSSLLFIQSVTEQLATALNQHVLNVPQTLQLRHTVHIHVLINERNCFQAKCCDLIFFF